MNQTSAPSEQLKIVIVGHVDHGKSTFVGRLIYDTGSLPDGKYEQLVKIAERRGVPFEWANLMDGLQAERDQNITIDTAQIWFSTKKRQYVIIISGRGEVDVVGGERVQLAPGRVLLAEDVTGKGHTTRVGADEDLVMLLVPLVQEP